MVHGGDHPPSGRRSSRDALAKGCSNIMLACHVGQLVGGALAGCRVTCHALSWSLVRYYSVRGYAMSQTKTTSNATDPTNSKGFVRAFTVDDFKRQLHGRLRRINVTKFHDQHVGLIDIISELYGQVQVLQRGRPSAQENEKLNHILQKLKDYTLMHLGEEEQFMREANFPGYDAHVKAHKQFVDALLKVEKQIQEQSVSYVVDLQHLVVSWLFAHINRMDTQYDRFAAGESYDSIVESKTIATKRASASRLPRQKASIADRVQTALPDVGVRRFNADHRALMNQVLDLQKLIDSLARGKPTDKQWRKIDETLSFLMRYMRKHFGEEESLMGQHGYPGLAEHRKDHQRFISKIDELKKELLENRNASFAVDLNFFLVEWFLTHTARLDTEYAEFFRAKGVH